MANTLNFNPIIWQDYAQAYLRRKNVFYNLAFRDETLKLTQGLTVQFPYWGLLSGDAQYPAADEQLKVNMINNDKFTITCKEMGDAIAISDTQLKTYMTRAAAEAEGADPDQKAFEDWLSESIRQMAFRFVSNIDKDLLTSIQSSYVSGFVNSGAATSDLFTFDNLLTAQYVGAGDRANEIKYVVMHSAQYADFVKSVGGLNAFNFQAIRQDIQESGFFRGSFNGMEFYVSDNVPAATAVGGKKCYTAFLFKENAFGVTTKATPQMEYVREVLARREVVASTMWYGVINLNQLISTDDVRIVGMTTATTRSA